MIAVVAYALLVTAMWRWAVQGWTAFLTKARQTRRALRLPKEPPMHD